MAAVPASYSYIKAKPDKEHLADRYWERRANVMLPTRLSVPNTIITALYADKPTVGSAFVPYRPIAGGHDQERVNKACVAYLNSSVGIIALLGVTSNRKIVYPNWSVEDHYRIPFPSWGKLSAAQIERLAGAYDALGAAPMLPLREMLGCAVRERLDAAVGEALGIPGDAVELARVALASEPAVTGRRSLGWRVAVRIGSPWGRLRILGFGGLLGRFRLGFRRLGWRRGVGRAWLGRRRCCLAR